MKLLFSSKEKLTIAAVVIILLIYILTAQFYFLSPLKSDLSAKKQELQSEQQRLADLRQRVNEIKQKGTENTTELQRQVPVKPLQDQFILDLQHAETVSNSQIKSMSFSEGGQAAAPTGSTNSTTNSTGSQQTSNNNANQNNQTSSSSGTSTQQQSNQSASPAASSNQQSTGALNKLTVQMSVESPTYEDFEKFIETIESLKRITVVEAINYIGPAEITSLTEGTKSFAFTVTVSAYYLPGLTDLEPQLPKVDYPDPANKANPLARFADLTTP